MKHNLLGAASMGFGENGREVSYPFFVAFISLLSNIELIKKIYLNATEGSRTMEITKGEMTEGIRLFPCVRVYVCISVCTTALQ